MCGFYKAQVHCRGHHNGASEFQQQLPAIGHVQDRYAFTRLRWGQLDRLEPNLKSIFRGRKEMTCNPHTPQRTRGALQSSSIWSGRLGDDEVLSHRSAEDFMFQTW